MVKNIIFPINNKGGVGKTSILTDLVAMLAQRYRVGVVDMDAQGSLEGTLFGGQSPEPRGSGEYDSNALDAIIMPKAEFTIKDPLKEIRFKVGEARVKVGRFPVGVLYHDAGKKQDLSSLVNGSMGQPDFIAVDLPPIPDAGLILDHSIKPLIEVLGGDVNLFPIVVTTPDHNVINIGFQGFKELATYLKSLGIPDEKIHPLSILNKFPMEKDFGEGLYNASRLPKSLWKRIEGVGMGDKLGIAGRPRNFKKRFDKDGYRFLSVFLPMMPEVRDGCFSLFYGRKPSITQYPYLATVAAKNGLPGSQRKTLEAYYLFAMNHLFNNMVEIANGQGRLKARRNFSYVVENYDRKELLNQSVSEILGLSDLYYETGQLPDKKTRVVELPSRQDYQDGIHLSMPNVVTIEQMAGVLHETGKELGVYVQGAEDIAELLEFGAKYALEDGEASRVNMSLPLQVASVRYDKHEPKRIELTIARKDHPCLAKREAVEAQSDRVDTFFLKLQDCIKS